MDQGRPTKYKPEYDELVYEHLKEGYSFKSFGGRIRVCEDTLFEWCKVHPSFSESKKEGVLAGLYTYEQDVIKMYKGKFDGGNATALVWKGKNMHGWTDRHEVKQDTTISINIDSDDSKL